MIDRTAAKRNAARFINSRTMRFGAAKDARALAIVRCFFNEMNYNETAHIFLRRLVQLWFVVLSMFNRKSMPHCVLLSKMHNPMQFAAIALGAFFL